MHELTLYSNSPGPADTTLTLPFESRQKSRLRVHLDSGEEAALFLERGQILRDGDRLRGGDGLVVEVRAAPEPVSTTASTEATLLARACYHLGNRHVALQIGAGWVRYRHDHVLDDLLRHLGLEVRYALAPFEPEAGAYHAGHDHGPHHHD
jgi:urease accessory protein